MRAMTSASSGCSASSISGMRAMIHRGGWEERCLPSLRGGTRCQRIATRIRSDAPGSNPQTWQVVLGSGGRQAVTVVQSLEEGDDVIDVLVRKTARLSFVPIEG